VGGEFACALLDNGTVKCWGYNNVGQLGQGNTTNLGDGGGEMGDALTAVDLGTNLTAKDMAVGYDHVCVIVDDSTDTYDDYIKCWGRGGYGALGHGGTDAMGNGANEMGDDLPYTPMPSGKTPSRIYAGIYTSCVLFTDNTTGCWGRNASGNLGIGHTDNIGDNASEMGDGLELIDWGSGLNVSKLIVNESKVCAIFTDNTSKCLGDNERGELGMGTPDYIGISQQTLPANYSVMSFPSSATVSSLGIGNNIGCAILSDNKLYCWGNATVTYNSGTLNWGDESSEIGSNARSPLWGTESQVTKIAMGQHAGFALFANGLMKSVGAGTNYIARQTAIGAHPDELGDNLSYVSMGTGRTVTDIQAGADFACALLDNATMKCWGENQYGQLGIGSTTDQGSATNTTPMDLSAIDIGTNLTVTQMSVGYDHTCVIVDDSTDTNDGKVKCWGRSNSGQLGQGATANRGDGGGEMGDSLAYTDLGTGRTATDIYAGNSFTCAILDNDTMKCWGYGADGRTLSGDTANLGDGGGEMGDNLSAADLGTSFTPSALGGGRQFGCVLSTTGSIKCFGTNTVGQLGLGTTDTMGHTSATVGDSLPAISLPTGRTAISITGNNNAYHACAVLDDNTVRCWGQNIYGQLGLGHDFNWGDNINEIGDSMGEPDVD